jgi:exodeoxyribonuclease III
VRVVNLYLPNGNPQPGPKFDYKIAWMERLRARMRELLACEMPTVVVGDFNVIPEDKDVFSVRAMASDALMQPASRDAYRRILNDGWTDAIDTCSTPAAGCGPIGTTKRARGSATTAFASITCCCRPIAPTGWSPPESTRSTAGREKASDHAPVWVELT